MLAEITHNYVNWIDGMKISKEHFLAFEDAVNDYLRDIRALRLTDNNYGLLPASPHTKHSLELRIHGNEVELLSCRGITREGVRIEITNFNLQKLTASIPKEDSSVLDNRSGGLYDIVVVVDSYDREPFGEPNSEESPPRHPFTLPKYSLELVPSRPKNTSRQDVYNNYRGDDVKQNSLTESNQTNYLRDFFNGTFLPVGLLRIEQGRPVLVKEYIPPCTSMSCSCEPSISPESIYSGLFNTLNIIRENALHVLQKVNARGAHKSILDNNIHAFAERTVFFLADTLDGYRLEMKEQSPIKTFSYFVRFANTLYTTLNCFLPQEKDNFIRYVSDWFQWTPSQLEHILRDSLSNRKYDHTDLKAMFGLINHFAETVAAMYEKLVELHFRDYQPKPEYTPPPPPKEPEPHKLKFKIKKDGRKIYEEDWD